jgi:hypothetical protein
VSGQTSSKYRPVPKGTLREQYRAQIPALDRKLLYILTDRADAEGSRTIRMYTKDMSAKLGASRRNVTAALGRLRDNEYILIEYVFSERGDKDASKYTILNPDNERREKIKIAQQVSGIPITRLIDYVYWLNFHKDKLKRILYPSLGDIAVLAHCPEEEVQQFVQGCYAAGILETDKEVSF